MTRRQLLLTSAAATVAPQPVMITPADVARCPATLAAIRFTSNDLQYLEAMRFSLDKIARMSPMSATITIDLTKPGMPAPSAGRLPR